MSPARTGAVIVAALVAGVAVVALELASEHRDARAVWAVFGPVVGWSFVGTGLYASRRRPREPHRHADDRARLRAGSCSRSTRPTRPPVYTFALVAGGLWGAVFLHLGLSFPTGRLRSRLDRALVIAGYIVFPAPGSGGCSPAGAARLRRLPGEPPDVRRDVRPTPFRRLRRAVLPPAVRHRLMRAMGCWRRPARSSGCGSRRSTFFAADLPARHVARAGVGDAAWWAAFIATGLLPLAFLGGPLRSHLSRLDAELQARMEELARRARGSCPPGTPRGGGSSATSTTAPRRGSSRSP